MFYKHLLLIYKEWLVLSLENKFSGDEIVLEVFKQELIVRQKIYERCEIYSHIELYHHTIIQATFVCLFVCVFPISSEVLWLIFAKLGGCV